jgi:hopanoid biosynthesis associated protein HpnK
MHTACCAEMVEPAVARKFLILTADDFGIDEAVNRAVFEAARSGVLTAASLMVGAPAAADAVAIARALPSLRVGLHVVLTDGWSVLPHRAIPGLVDGNGRFMRSMVADAVRAFASARIQRQIAAEIRAQFHAFRATGLELDHVNAHKHFHLHPTLLRLILDIGSEFGIRAMRVPQEPLWLARASGRKALMGAVLLRPWLALMKRRLRERGVMHNDSVFGIACSGNLDEATLLAILEKLPPGATEIYLHPGVPAPPAAMCKTTQAHTSELQALTSRRVRAALQSTNVVCGGFTDLITAPI